MPPRGARLPALAYEPGVPHALRVQVQHFRGGRHPMIDYPPHTHRFFMMCHVERGGGLHRIGAREQRVRAGDLFLISPGEVHDARGLRADGWNVLFTADAIEPGRREGEQLAPGGLAGDVLLVSFLRPLASGGRLRVPPAQRPRWRARLTELADELATRRTGDIEAARALLRLLLVDTVRLAESQLGGLAPAARPLLAQVFAFIDARFRQPISLVDVARAVGRSRAHLTTVVTRQTGRPVLAWIVERRLTEARRLLVETDDTVENIAAAVSYQDPSTFIRRFRRAHAMTPQAWRRAVRGQGARAHG